MDFWETKIGRNKARDRYVTRTLRAAGWRVLRIWDGARPRGDGRVEDVAPQRSEGVSAWGALGAHTLTT